MEKAKYKPKPAELSEEKSGLGLGDAYAKEYEELIMGHTSAERSKIEQAQHEVKELFSKLGQRLDGLFNFHAVPKPFKSEVSVKSKVSAIRMEEAMPTAMAESMSLAPEEVYGKKKGNALTTRTELSQAERKAERRKKKRVKKRVTGEKDHVEEVRARINPEGTSAKRKGMVVDGPHAKKAQKGGGEREFTRSAQFFRNFEAQQKQAKVENAKAIGFGGGGGKKRTAPDGVYADKKSKAYKL